MFNSTYSILVNLFETSKYFDDGFTVGVYRAAAWASIITTIVLYLLFYVFITLTSYRTLVRHNAGKKWMAFIPFVQIYAIILTSKEESILKMPKKTFGILFVVFAYAYYVVNIVDDIFYGGGIPILKFLFSTGDKSLEQLQYILSVEDISSAYPYFGLDLWDMVFRVAYAVFLFVFALSYFRFRTPYYKALSILFGIFFRPVLPFLLFAFRNREETDRKRRYVVISEENFNNYQNGFGQQSQPFSDFSNKSEQPFAEFSEKKEQPFSEFNSPNTEDAQEKGDAQSENKGGDDLFD